MAIEELGIPSLNLMENAGRGCADAILHLDIGGGVVVLCGRGNNGGDGFVIARHLQSKGRTVSVILMGKSENVSGDALVNLQRLAKTKVDVIELPLDALAEQIQKQLSIVDGIPTSIIVDAMLGTGATGPLRPPYDRVVEIANAMDAKRVAVDLPSGFDGDTGLVVNEAFRADLTCTFIARKTGMTTANGHRYCGEVQLIDIGLPEEALTRVSQ